MHYQKRRCSGEVDENDGVVGLGLRLRRTDTRVAQSYLLSPAEFAVHAFSPGPDKGMAGLSRYVRRDVNGMEGLADMAVYVNRIVDNNLGWYT